MEENMIYTLEAKKRNNIKKSELNALRTQGMIPAVLYGKGLASTSISIDKATFMRFYKKSFTELTFYEIELDGKKYHTILKDKLIHPVTRDILHIDFMQIQESALMEFELPIQFVGEAAGAKEGGFTDVVQRTVKIVCKANEVPEEISVDVSNLHVGDSLRIQDLPVGAWQYKDNDDVTIVVVHGKKAEEPAVSEAAEPSAEADTDKTE